MTKKLSIIEIERAVRGCIQDNAIVENVLTEIRQIAQETETTQDEALPKAPTQCVTILFGAQEELDKIDESQLYAYTVLCNMEDIDSQEKLSRLIPHMVQKSSDFNSKKKRKSGMIKKLTTAFEKLKPKDDLDGFPKRIITKKEPALILKTTNLNISTERING